MAIFRGSGGIVQAETTVGPNSTITELLGLTGAVQFPSYIEFASNQDITPTVRQLTWNEAEGTLDLGLNSGEVVLQIGEETLYRVVNQSGNTITNGTLCMAVGTLGNSGRLLIAPWNGTAPSKTIMGIATEDIENGGNGYVTHFGKVRGIQTNGGNYSESWQDGDILWAGPTGGLTKTRPIAPKTKTVVAIVIRAHGSNGTLFVRPTLGSNLGEDDLVELDNIQDGEILRYNSDTSRFENVNPSSVEGFKIVTISQLAPTSGDGSDGDVWFQIT